MIVVSMAGIARFQDLGIQQINLKNLKTKQNKTKQMLLLQVSKIVISQCLRRLTIRIDPMLFKSRRNH